MHDAIVGDGVPRYMVTNDVASMCVDGEVSRPHAALFLVPLPCHFLWYMNSYGTVKRANNVERESTFTPMKWSLEKGPTEGSGGGARARKSPLWEALSYPPNTLKFRLARDIIPGEELLHNYFFPGSREGNSERSDNKDEDSSDGTYEDQENQNNGEDTNSPGRTERGRMKKRTLRTLDMPHDK